MYIEFEWLALGAIALFTAFGVFAWKMANIHYKASQLSRCISKMLYEPDRAEEHAQETQRHLQSAGLWH